jgi:hypothetical protein
VIKLSPRHGGRSVLAKPLASIFAVTFWHARRVKRWLSKKFTDHIRRLNGSSYGVEPHTKAIGVGIEHGSDYFLNRW